jgi:serine phosphatase RsbU (regulator of sigma subunit)
MERFEKILVENRNLHVEEIAARIIDSVDDFSKDYIQHDDITLVLFKWGN